MKIHSRIAVVAASLLGVGLVAATLPSVEAQGAADAQKAVDAAYAKYRTLKEGKNADYIPALAKVDSNLFGIALVTADGRLPGRIAGTFTAVMPRSAPEGPSPCSSPSPPPSGSSSPSRSPRFTWP